MWGSKMWLIIDEVTIARAEETKSFYALQLSDPLPNFKFHWPKQWRKGQMQNINCDCYALVVKLSFPTDILNSTQPSQEYKIRNM